MTQRRMLGALALLLGLGALVMSGAGSAGASSYVTGTGTYSCTKLTGKLTFTPALTLAGGKAETIKVSTTAAGCTGGKPVPAKVVGTATIKLASNSCTGLQAATPIMLNQAYTPLVTAGVFKGTAKGTLATAVTFSLTGKMSGSYVSALATAKATLTQTGPQVLAACGGSGLGSVTIAKGTVTKF